MSPVVKMQDIGITELKAITEWSYPTALKFAQKHGIRIDREMGGSRWVIPFNKVAGVVQQNVAQALRMQARLFDFEDSHKL